MQVSAEEGRWLLKCMPVLSQEAETPGEDCTSSCVIPVRTIGTMFKLASFPMCRSESVSLSHLSISSPGK